MEKYEEANNERATLAEQIELMESSYAEERLKLEATKAQQTKLIDFLQYKTEGQNTKKKKVWHHIPEHWPTWRGSCIGGEGRGVVFPISLLFFTFGPSPIPLF